jgi:thiol-disulfide isomerase/thioredoxin
MITRLATPFLALAALLAAGQDPPDPGRADPRQAPAVIEKAATVGVGKRFGGDLVAPLLADVKLLVVAFTQVDCPVARLYKPTLERLEREYRAKGVRFFGVSSDDAAWAGLFDLRRTTETFVLDPPGMLRYRGAIDDQYGIGYQREAATRNYLTDALEALLAGKAPPVAATEAPG